MLIAGGFSLRGDVTIHVLHLVGGQTGRASHILRLNAEAAYIWSSATLYSEQMHGRRSNWFEDWLRTQIRKVPEDVLRFHHEAGDGDWRTNVLMNRGDIIQTVSISCLVVNAEEKKFLYEDIQQKEKTEIIF